MSKYSYNYDLVRQWVKLHPKMKVILTPCHHLRMLVTQSMLLLARPWLFQEHPMSKLMMTRMNRGMIISSTSSVMLRSLWCYIDDRSCVNVSSKLMIDKLGFKIQKHPRPYHLQWLNEYGEMRVTKLVLIYYHWIILWWNTLWNGTYVGQQHFAWETMTIW